MLQNNPIYDLQTESDQRIARQIRAEPIVFSENSIITAPPRNGSAAVKADPGKAKYVVKGVCVFISAFIDPRKPLPISTLQFGDPRIPGATSFIPRSGLDFLYGIPSIHIEQTVSLHETSATSENRYTVRTSTNEAIFGASESSTQRDRLIWGSVRPFSLHLLDKTHQEAVSYRRKLRLGMYYLQPQYLEIWAPPGDLLGTVRETYTLYSADFVIQNPKGDIIAQIEGPPKFLCFCNSTELYLKVLSPDYTTQLGSITRTWNTDISTFTQNIYFTNPSMDVKMKALFLGAAFLTEYMYFQSRCC